MLEHWQSPFLDIFWKQESRPLPWHEQWPRWLRYGVHPVIREKRRCWWGLRNHTRFLCHFCQHIWHLQKQTKLDYEIYHEDITCLEQNTWDGKHVEIFHCVLHVPKIQRQHWNYKFFCIPTSFWEIFNTAQNLKFEFLVKVICQNYMNFFVDFFFQASEGKYKL